MLHFNDEEVRVLRQLVTPDFFDPMFVQGGIAADLSPDGLDRFIRKLCPSYQHDEMAPASPAKPELRAPDLYQHYKTGAIYRKLFETEALHNTVQWRLVLDNLIVATNDAHEEGTHTFAYAALRKDDLLPRLFTSLPYPAVVYIALESGVIFIREKAEFEGMAEGVKRFQRSGEKILRGWISVSGVHEKVHLESLGVKVGQFVPDGGRYTGDFTDCEVSQDAFERLEPLWHTRYVWSLK